MLAVAVDVLSFLWFVRKLYVRESLCMPFTGSMCGQLANASWLNACISMLVYVNHPTAWLKRARVSKCLCESFRVVDPHLQYMLLYATHDMEERRRLKEPTMITKCFHDVYIYIMYIYTCHTHFSLSLSLMHYLVATRISWMCGPQVADMHTFAKSLPHLFTCSLYCIKARRSHCLRTEIGFLPQLGASVGYLFESPSNGFYHR